MNIPSKTILHSYSSIEKGQTMEITVDRSIRHRHIKCNAGLTDGALISRHK